MSKTSGGFDTPERGLIKMNGFPDKKLSPAWKRFITPVLKNAQSRHLADLLKDRADRGAVIYPDREHWFHALEVCPLEKVKVVILGQDPYHGPGQAHGLAFSVRPGVRTPRSLANIFKEVCAEYGANPKKQDPFLERWAQQGVLLLNTVLTVEENAAGCHRKRGWEQITDAALDAVVVSRPKTVFMLWGNDAKVKKERIGEGHLVLEAAHPSPLSASRGFFGCRHFKQANAWLEKKGESAIRWV